MTVQEVPSHAAAEQTTSHIALSVVLPVKDEAGSLRQLFREIVDAVEGLDLPGSAEIIFIDDGSTDGSIEVIEELVRRQCKRHAHTISTQLR